LVAPQGNHQRPCSGYSLHVMAGPIMSNVYSPGNQMALFDGMSLQYPPHQMGAPMYTHHPGQQHQNDRPFKCDQCPQSFNRDYDLKRHKRVHSAVRLFSCRHCDRAFWRKDSWKVRSYKTHEGRTICSEELELINIIEACPSQRLRERELTTGLTAHL
jgi:uncharacterized Zn-finger protein